MKIAKGGWSHIGFGVAVTLIGVVGCQAGAPVVGWSLTGLGVFLIAFMVYFFRNPERPESVGREEIVSGADGWIRQVTPVREEKHLGIDTIRVSTFLTPFDVHVNRSPIPGRVTHLSYTPGRHFLTIRKEASDFNEHSSIVVEGERTRCLVKQIVGPIVRRVVYWLHEGQTLRQGERIGIMKFGSRLDVYLPAADVDVVVKPGDRVFAGITVIARLKRKDRGS